MTTTARPGLRSAETASRAPTRWSALGRIVRQIAGHSLANDRERAAPPTGTPVGRSPGGNAPRLLDTGPDALDAHHLVVIERGARLADAAVERRAGLGPCHRIGPPGSGAATGTYNFLEVPLGTPSGLRREALCTCLATELVALRSPHDGRRLADETAPALAALATRFTADRQGADAATLADLARWIDSLQGVKLGPHLARLGRCAERDAPGTEPILGTLAAMTRKRRNAIVTDVQTALRAFRRDRATGDGFRLALLRGTAPATVTVDMPGLDQTREGRTHTSLFARLVLVDLATNGDPKPRPVHVLVDPATAPSLEDALDRARRASAAQRLTVTVADPPPERAPTRADALDDPIR